MNQPNLNPSTETVNVTDLAKLDAAFANAHRYLTHGVIANYRVGFWLNRAKEVAPHGHFFPLLERVAKDWEVSVETLRRRMSYYREIKSGLAKLPFGLAVPADELDEVIADEQASEEKIAQAKSAIEAAAIRQKHVDAPKNLAANLRLEGVDGDRHKALTKTIAHIKRVVGPVEFTDKVAEYLVAWEKTLPLEAKKTRKAKKSQASE